MDQMQVFLYNQQQVCWFLEHNHVITTGRPTYDCSHMLDIPLVVTDRGGGKIYHGPGQRVIYFVAPLLSLSSNIASFVKNLEETISAACQELGKKAHIRLDGPGVWVENNQGLIEKIAFIGLRVSKNGWVTHGIAVNLACQLNHFNQISVCDKEAVVGNLDLDMKTFDFVLLKHLRVLIPNMLDAHFTDFPL